MLPLVFLVFLHLGECARILGVFSCPSYSHQVVFQPIWLELAQRGHDMTVITPNVYREENLTNLRQIDVSWGYQILHSNVNFSKVYTETNLIAWKKQLEGQQTTLLTIDEGILQMDEVQKVLNEEQFDLVLVQWFTPTMLALGAKFKCPIVAVISFTPFNYMYEAMGNPVNSVLYPEYMTGLDGDLTFFERLESSLFSLWQRYYIWTYVLPRADKIIQENIGDNLPSLKEVQNNVSFLLMNVNALVTKSRPNVANVIEFSGLHIRKPRPLPEDIKLYLDNSTEGVVYLSLGTNVKSSLLSQNLRETIIEAVKELPYKVLWKYETDNFPNKPENVMIRKWLPQQDILGHKNVKVFVTQGGAQSLEEAIYNEVPVVGIPIFSDQPRNIKIASKLEIGLGVNVKTVTKDELKRTILEVINNKKYKNNIQRRAALAKDQPMNSLDKVIWYIEYTLRHNGPQHFRSHYADLPYWKYFLVDQLLFLVAILWLVAAASCRLIKLVLRLRRHFYVKIKHN